MESFHGTTIVCVRRETPQGIEVAIGGDGQVTLGNIVVKGTARKVRKLYRDQVLVGFAGPPVPPLGGDAAGGAGGARASRCEPRPWHIR